MEEPKPQEPQESAVNPGELSDDVNHDVFQPPKPESKKKWLLVGLAGLLAVAGLVYWFVLRDELQIASKTPVENEALEEYMKVPESGIEVPYSSLNSADTYEIKTGVGIDGELLVFYNLDLFDAQDSLTENQREAVIYCLDNPRSGIARVRLGENWPNEKHTQNSILAEIDGYGYLILEPGEDCTNGDEEVRRIMNQYVWMYDRTEATKRFIKGSTFETWISDNISYTVNESWSEEECEDAIPPHNLIYPDVETFGGCDDRTDLVLIEVLNINYSHQTRCLTDEEVKAFQDTKPYFQNYECEVINLGDYQATKTTQQGSQGSTIDYLIFQDNGNKLQVSTTYYSNEEGQLVNLDMFEEFVKSIRFVN